ncbi:hypothetical protein BCR41DRAFT_214237 [Lobosporangium transversale]|uniref:BZIP domain-containing protein n=1 Tax=Lobosporangium transversale TaxID=64571 RepID=A0A1Y2G7E8_9FUNG|nr:hypothetical protein BCR41DRAFT_214237 [Lobosporangium transversale]ORY99806.1 hypothetical protein BCR41DRAFT_214237 [Lobosporangium transversale]|eukprot:XP_021876040.1 hypothetical protein BCR41DRAFT_214237 [Lobosporangium transversale]
MFSTTTSCLPHMMAHASSADVPHNSEVSTADLDSEAFVTIPSATPSSPSLFSTTTENMQLDMLTHLLEAHNNSAATTDRNCATDDPSAILLSDPSVIAMASPSSVWTTSPSISPMLLKLESPVLTNPDSTQRSARIKTKSKSKSKTTATTSSSTLTAVNTSGRKRAAVDPIEKEAKVRERVLRNRAAAQESRDKKRKYVADIEASNESLQQENAQLLKRLKTVESNNLELSQRLEALTAQFAQMQQLLSQSIKHNNPSGVGFCQYWQRRTRNLILEVP